MCSELSPLIPEIRQYLSRVMPRGVQETDRLSAIIERLDKHGIVGRSDEQKIRRQTM